MTTNGNQVSRRKFLERAGNVVMGGAATAVLGAGVVKLLEGRQEGNSIGNTQNRANGGRPLATESDVQERISFSEQLQAHKASLAARIIDAYKESEGDAINTFDGTIMNVYISAPSEAGYGERGLTVVFDEQVGEEPNADAAVAVHVFSQKFYNESGTPESILSVSFQEDGVDHQAGSGDYMTLEAAPDKYDETTAQQLESLFNNANQLIDDALAHIPVN